jgi:probable F420-dependent oxidoreductase
VRIGLQFPHRIVGSDPAAVLGFAQGAEDSGFDYLFAFEHVAGAHPDRFRAVDTGFRSPPYLYDDPFHEPFTLFAFLAGATRRIEFTTTVLVLPQRQTVLVAKQAAEVSILSGGRLRLGVGVGWNHAEYEALGADFHSRGRRVDEQVTLLRRLWTEPLVSFHGRWHNLDRIGIAPLPQAPIPVWIGGGLGTATLRRVARLGDGWMPMGLGAAPDEVVARVRTFLAEAGRAPSSLGIQGAIGMAGGPAEWVAAARAWEGLGATHLSISIGDQDPPVSAMERLKRASEVRRALKEELGY